MDENKVEATTISKYDYYTDEVGRRTFVAHEGSAFDCVGAHHWQFLYNDRNELTNANRITGATQGQGTPMLPGNYDYTYDPIGNRIDSSGEGRQTTYTPNDVNQYLDTSNPAESFAYDTDGNLTADGTYKYMWDGENRLIEIVTKRTDDEYQPGDKRLRFRYDYMSRRVEKVFSVYKATGWSERKRQRYVYDGWNVILVLDGGNNVKTSYTWGLDLSGSLQGAGGVGGLLAEFKMNGQYPEAHWFTYDGNGNVAQVLNGYTTIPVTVAAHYEYDPYGNTIASPGDYADANPFRFSTKWLDSELASWTNHGAIGSSGFYYYGYRYYSPRLGRWVNRDPIGERGGLNLVAFLSNAPIMKIDLLGMLCCNKCNPTTATKRVTGFAVALGPATNGYSSWTQATANGAVSAARLIGDFEEKGGYVRDVLTNLKNGIGVLASDLAKSIPGFAYGKMQDIYTDAIIGIVNTWSDKLAADAGVRIWVKVDFEKCDREWCLFVMRRYKWLKDDLKHPCTTGTTPIEPGIPVGETNKIAKAVPDCIKQALNKIK